MSVPFFISTAERNVLFSPLAKRDERSNVSATTKSAGKLVFLESARGVAAVVVALYHISLGLLPRDALLQHPPVYVSKLSLLLHRALEAALAVGLNGPFAVRFFFVLSGFVLSRSYLKSRDIDVLRSAAMRRFPRLAVPVAGTILLAWGLTSCVRPLGSQVAAMTNQTAGSWIVQEASHQLPLAAALVQALYGAIFNFSWDTTLDGSLWTMHVELFNSFVIFAMLPLIAGLPRRGSIYAGLAVLLTAAQQAYTLDFVAGMAIADMSLHAPLEFKRLLQGRRMLLMVAAFLMPLPVTMLIQRSGNFGLYAQWFQTLCAATVLVGLLNCAALQRALETRLLSHMGKISFGFYLIHMPIFATVGVKIYLVSRTAFHATHLQATALTTVATISLSWVMAIAMHRWLEQPGMSLGRAMDQWVRGTSQPRKTAGEPTRPLMALAS